MSRGGWRQIAEELPGIMASEVLAALARALRAIGWLRAARVVYGAALRLG